MNFLNVDLEIVGFATDLDLVALAFGETAVVIAGYGAGKDEFRSFETYGSFDGYNDTIRGFCELVEAFDETTQSAWVTLGSRVLNIGLEMHPSESSQMMVPPDLYQRVHRLGFAIQWTVYPPELD